MNSIKIAQYDNCRGLTARQTVDTANHRKAVLRTNKDFDLRLVKTDTWKSEKNIYPVWTGTQVAYAKKNEKIGNFIEYTDSKTGIRYVFEAGDAKGEKNVIIAINQGFTQGAKSGISCDTSLITYVGDGGNNVFVRIAEEAKADILTGFPKSDNWYLADRKFGIPVGEKADSSKEETRYLWRLDGAYVGLLARSYHIGVSGCRDVLATFRPSNRFGALAAGRAMF